MPFPELHAPGTTAPRLTLRIRSPSPCMFRHPSSFPHRPSQSPSPFPAARFDLSSIQTAYIQASLTRSVSASSTTPADSSTLCPPGQPPRQLCTFARLASVFIPAHRQFRFFLRPAKAIVTACPRCLPETAVAVATLGRDRARGTFIKDPCNLSHLSCVVPHSPVRPVSREHIFAPLLFAAPV